MFEMSSLIQYVITTGDVIVQKKTNRYICGVQAKKVTLIKTDHLEDFPLVKVRFPKVASLFCQKKIETFNYGAIKGGLTTCASITGDISRELIQWEYPSGL